jgi:hypothetical protein
MFSGSNERDRPAQGNDADIRLTESSYQQRFSLGWQLKKICIPTQCPERDSLHASNMSNSLCFGKTRRWRRQGSRI